MVIKMRKRRWIAKILVIVLLVTGLPCYQKQEAKAAGNLLWPVPEAKLGCGLNCTCAIHGGYHNGIDINGVPEGTNIIAAESRVLFVLITQCR